MHLVYKCQLVSNAHFKPMHRIINFLCRCENLSIPNYTYTYISYLELEIVRLVRVSCLNYIYIYIYIYISRRGNQKGVRDISPALQESLNKNITVVWSDFVYWFQLFIIKSCTLMDDSTFASRKAHQELSFDIGYISPFHQKCHLCPSGSHPSIYLYIYIY